jgi:hypothetical protein
MSAVRRHLVAGALLTGGVMAVTVAIFAAALGSAAAIVGVVPRLRIDVPRAAEPSSPLPSSMTITNEFIPLDNVSVFLRVCSIFTPDKKDTVPGPVSCNASSPTAGGLTLPDWQKRHLAPDKKWTIPMGSNVPFRLESGAADIMIVVSYRPWLVPKPLLNLREYRARFASREKAGGQRIWLPRSLDETKSDASDGLMIEGERR